jgi:hypothetical protein
MTVPIPTYLREIISVEKIKKDYMVLNVVCCPPDEFKVFFNKVKRTEEQERQDRALDDFYERNGRRRTHYDWLDNGEVYVFKKNIFGKIVDRIVMPKDIDDTRIVKVVCKKCGKETIVFDNRIHGRDAFPSEDRGICPYDEIEFVQHKIKGTDDDSVKISLEICNEPSLEEFIEHVEEQATQEQYSNAFSEILIYGTTARGKEILLFGEES